MTWPSHIFFSLALGAVAWAQAPVSGRVELRDSKDALVRKGLNYSGVVVWLEPLLAPDAAPAPVRARMEQRGKTFLPHVLPVQAGSLVEFPNFDPIFHNAFSNYNGQLFDIGLYPPGTTRSVRFSRPGVVRVFCNIHPNMSAVIVTVNTPYFTTSGTDGGFRLEGVPPGEYRLRVFHERATAPTLAALTRVVSVTAAPLVLPPLTISENGYLAIPHTNKFGHEYHTPADENSLYPAARP
jgi:plastocyanin